MSELAALALGALLPLPIAVLEQPHWAPAVRALAALAVSAASAAVVVGAGGWGWRGWAEACLLTFVAASVFYEHLWRAVGLAGAIEVWSTAALMRRRERRFRGADRGRAESL